VTEGAEPKASSDSSRDSDADAAGKPEEELPVSPSLHAAHVDGERIAVGACTTSACHGGTDGEKRTGDLAESSLRAHTSSTEIEVAVLLGGMDTAGEIFDDCMLMRLSSGVQCVK
jgi:hypothetical protein